MSMRVAKGTELPRGWSPGQPLTVGRAASSVMVQPTGCPFGPDCYSCRNGLQWDAALGKHSGHYTRRKVSRKGGRSHRSQQNH